MWGKGNPNPEAPIVMFKSSLPNIDSAVETSYVSPKTLIYTLIISRLEDKLSSMHSMGLLKLGDNNQIII